MGRRIVEGIGRVMFSSGVLILLFVAYQLWGTGIHEARSQDKLRDEFEQALSEFEQSYETTTTTVAPGEDPPPTPSTTVPVGPPPPPTGKAIAIIRIPRIGVDKAVVEGVGVGDLKKGPGHFPDTPQPGQPGNSAIAGHRTTYGAPFGSLDKLGNGDEILVTTRQGQFRYEVTESKVVRPNQVEVLAPTEDDRLTLSTCHPRYSASKRLIVVARLTGPAAAPSPPPPATEPPPEEQPDTTEPTLPDEEPEEEPVDEIPETDAEAREIAEETIEGDLSGDTTARWPAFWWALAAAAVALFTKLASIRFNKWLAYLIGTPAFLLVLFVFFENFSRLLPANI